MLAHTIKQPALSLAYQLALVLLLVSGIGIGSFEPGKKWITSLAVSPTFNPITQSKKETDDATQDKNKAEVEGKKPNLELFAQPDIKNTVRITKINSQLHCLALNIYFEARGEPEAGRRAVGHVVMNRVAHSRFPSSICGVVQQGGQKRRYRCQFSWWCDGRTDTPKDSASWRKSLIIANEIYAGKSDDPTGGALWYHADYVSPKWQKSFVKGPKIGQHVFYLAA